jgi:predicted metal-binding protein
MLYNNIKNHNPDINIKPVRCLAGCKKGCTLSLWHKDKWSYIIGNLTPDLNEQDIIYGFEEYKKTTDGKIPFSRRPNAFKNQSLARIPPLNYELNEDE